MRIAFDTTPLVRPYPPGVVHSCRGLTEALRELSDVDLVAVAPEPGENERHWRHVSLPGQLQRLNVLGVHSPISAFPARGPGRRLATVHELPWRNGCAENAGVQHRFWARYAVGRADAVLCPTEFVRKQLVQEAGNGLHIHHCPWGLEPAKALALPMQESVLRGLGLESQAYFVMLGATRPKKNLERCVRALCEWNSRPQGKPLQLVVSGAESDSLRQALDLARVLGLRAQVHAVGHVADAELSALVAAARFTAVLSVSEGFGFPVLESYRVGTPVLVSEGSAQAEVAGPLGLAADPTDCASIAAGFGRALQFDAARKDELKAHAARYSWQRCAAQVRDLWGAWA